MAIGKGTHHEQGRDCAVGARAVVNNQRLPQRLAHRLRENARYYVSRTARGNGTTRRIGRAG